MNPYIDIEAAQREGLTVVYCLNSACRKALMVCDRDKLYLNGKQAVSYDRVRITCECGTPRTWRPSPKEA